MPIKGHSHKLHYKNGIKKCRFFLQGDVLLGPKTWAMSDYWFALSVCGTQVVATQQKLVALMLILTLVLV